MIAITHRVICSFLVVTLFGFSVASAPLQAQMIGTEAFLRADGDVERQQVLAWLERGEVAQRLTALGVDPEQAKERVEVMTDAEVATLASRIDQLPAGGDFFGTVAFLFLVLLVTDILGFTNLFPFVRSTAD